MAMTMNMSMGEGATMVHKSCLKKEPRADDEHIQVETSGKPGYSTQVGNEDEDYSPYTPNMTKKKMKDDRLVLRDADKMKEELYAKLGEKEYDVSEFYHKKGIAQFIARNDKFGNATLFVICLNAVWIGVDTDRNNEAVLSKARLEFQVMEHFFCIFFSFEWLVRLLAFANKMNCFRDGWFKFDTALVWMMIGETWIMPAAVGDGEGGGGMGDASILRLLRLLRLTRMARLLKAMPELVTMLKGMAAATRSVGSTLLLLVLFLYVFGIIFKQQAEGNELLEEYFSPIPMAMWNLLMAGTLLDDIKAVLNDVGGQSWVLCVIFLVFVLISSFTVLNMLIGVLCEIVGAVAKQEKEGAVVKFVKQTLLGVLIKCDNEGDGKIDRLEFENFVNHPESEPAFKELGVDRDNLLSLIDVIFSEASEEINEFQEALSKQNPQIVDAQIVAPRMDRTNTESRMSRTIHDVSATSFDSRNGRGDQLEIPKSPKSPLREHRSQRNVISHLSTNTMSSQRSLPKRVRLSYADVIQMILDLRSSNEAMVKDVVELRKFARKNQDRLMGNLERMELHYDARFQEVHDKHDEVYSDLKSLVSRIGTVKELIDNKSFQKPTSSTTPQAAPKAAPQAAPPAG
jgi:voltage-gated sodium channel